MAFCAALGLGSSWAAACNACLGELGRVPADASLGFVYVSAPLAHALDLITERLRTQTGVANWVGSSGLGVCGPTAEEVHDGGVAVLVTALPAASYQLFDDVLPALDQAARAARPLAIVHGDAQPSRTVAEIARLGDRLGAFLVGGLAAVGQGMQMAGQPTEGGLSGVRFQASLPIITGIAQGCQPIGPSHRVSAVDGPWIERLDGRPALAVLEEDVGELLARDLARLRGFILAARPLAGGQPSYLVRTLAAVDRARGRLAIGDELRAGDELLFVKRDPAGARTELRHMLLDLRARAAGRPILGGLYHCSAARGPKLFGAGESELAMIEQALGRLPLAGLYTCGEIFADQLYAYAGVLTLFLGEAAAA